MPKYRHTGEWTNTFHLPDLAPFTAAPGQVVSVPRRVEHPLLQPVDGAAEATRDPKPRQPRTRRQAVPAPPPAPDQAAPADPPATEEQS